MGCSNLVWISRPRWKLKIVCIYPKTFTYWEEPRNTIRVDKISCKLLELLEEAANINDIFKTFFRKIKRFHLLFRKTYFIFVISSSVMTTANVIPFSFKFVTLSSCASFHLIEICEHEDKHCTSRSDATTAQPARVIR